LDDFFIKRIVAEGDDLDIDDDVGGASAALSPLLELLLSRDNDFLALASFFVMRVFIIICVESIKCWFDVS